MTALFTDDFNRADGAPGNGWTVASGTADILSNQLRGHVATARVSRSVPSGAASDLTVALVFPSNNDYSGSWNMYVELRVDSAHSSLYRVLLVPGPLGYAEVQILQVTPSRTNTIARFSAFALTSGTHTFTVSLIGTSIVAKLDNAVIGSATDGVIASGGYLHIGMSGTDKWFIDSVAIYDERANGLVVLPYTMAPTTTGVTLNVYGNGTTWTPGVPGSPTFTVDAGTITYQHVITATEATLTYNAPAYAQTVLLTDPDSGATAQLSITIGNVLPPGAGSDPLGVFAWLQRLNKDLVNLLNASAAALLDGETPAEGESVLGWVRRIGTPAEGETLATYLETALRELQVDGEDPTTLRSVLVDVLAELYTVDGYPTRHTIQDVLDAISSIDVTGSGGGSEVLAGIVSQLTAIQTSLYYIDGIDTLNLDQVMSRFTDVDTNLTTIDQNALDTKQAVNAISGTGTYDLQGLAIGEAAVGAIATAGLIVAIIGLVRGTAATAIQTVALVEDVVSKGTNWAQIAGAVLGFLSDYAVPSPTALSTDLTTVINDILGVHDDLGTDLTTITDAISGSELDLASKIDALDAKLDSVLEALGTQAFSGSLWPGADLVTLGTPVAISESMRLEGTIEGIVYEVATVPSGTRTADIAGQPSYGALGIVSFESDSGHVERFQTISFKKSLLVPKSMVSAAACVLEWRPGTTGTVTPWARTVV